MRNYYDILGISRGADITVIKSAYKRLALKYHPDRNPNNTAAEEYFKQVNEAYSILGNEEKRKRYDFLLNYSYQTTTTQSTTYSGQTTTTSSKSPGGYKNVYNRYGKSTWKNAPRYKKAIKYKVDKDYYKIQLITLLVIIAMIGSGIGIAHYNKYIEEQHQAKVAMEKEKALNQADRLYKKGEYQEAIDIITSMSEKYPFESQLYMVKSSMIEGLFDIASFDYQQGVYNKAAENLEIISNYQRPPRRKTWEMLADSYFHLGNYEKSIHAYDQVLQRDELNINLAVKIGNIYWKHLDSPSKALEYYDEAKIIFKKFQAANYGPAFELLVPGERLPEYYFELFEQRAILNTLEGKIDEAITDYNWAIFMRPKNGEMYHKRAELMLTKNENYWACRDWKKAVARGHEKSKQRLQKFCLTN